MSIKNCHIICFVLCALLYCSSASAQDKDHVDGVKERVARLDSMRFDSMRVSRYKFINNIFQQAVNSVKKSPNDTSEAEIYLKGKSEDPFLPYQGKIIRHIYINSLGFDRNLKDTTERQHSFINKVANNLHPKTKDFVVRDNLFINEKTPLNAFKVADNERYLRTLEYIHDARIVIDTLVDNPDSVDITVYTKDFFSISAGGASNGLNHIRIDASDVNVGGMGQRIDASGLYDYTRNPNFAYGGAYKKDNVFHSFIDASVGYSTLNGSAFTREEEFSEYVSLSRPLVSPYSHFAGALNISHNAGYNSYNAPDSTFFTYKYNLFDVWAGYNIAIHKLTATNNNVRDRRFFSIRYFNRKFTDVPTQVGDHYDPIYNDQQAVLGQLTFFRQDYYKTQYIYGFGTTEDLPYGYNVSVTAGWHKQLNLQRPYAGINAFRYIATNRGDFIQFFLRSGGFLYKDKVQDGSFLIGATAYSRIIFVNSTKIRQYIMVSYTHLYNRVTYAPLRIDNGFGIRGFLSDSAEGAKRLSIQLETVCYLKYKILGFQFAPFPYFDMSLITPQDRAYSKSSLYTSLGGGIRARNENLVFETIELRAFFFPVTPTNQRGFKLVLNANIRYRYTSNYINAPDLVKLNDL